jgi:hypothetical protein
MNRLERMLFKKRASYQFVPANGGDLNRMLQIWLQGKTATADLAASLTYCSQYAMGMN